MARPRPQLRSVSVSLVAAAALGALVSCGEGNPGIDPPVDGFSFPAGLTLDPRVSTVPSDANTDDGVCSVDADCSEGSLCGSIGQCRASARWLFVTNANSDRRFNAGSLVAVDLNHFWSDALDDPSAVLGVDATLDDADGQRCRRVANLPQTVECIEEAFVEADATVQFGNFPGPPTTWDVDPDDDEAVLLIPVRGDPSITYVELTGDPDATPVFSCEQSGTGEGALRCGDNHRLRFVRNEPDQRRLSREPFRVVVSPDPKRKLAYVSHQGDPDMTLIDLEYEPAPRSCSSTAECMIDAGETCSGGVCVREVVRPAIIHQANILGLFGAPITFQGGFGIAERPCSLDNAPNATLGCERPLVYGAMRWAKELRTFTAITNKPGEDEQSTCINAGDTTVGGIVCDFQAEPLRSITVAGLSTAEVPLSSSRPILADAGFSRTGDELYVVQSNPGGLLRIDTSIGDDGETVDISAGQVEVCSQPTTLAIYDDGQVEYGIVTCYRSGEIFIVDLAQLTVVGLSRGGIGPDAIAIDLAREAVYIANSLDATVSVIDMDPRNPARFTQIARIGLQEPYVQ